MSRDQEVDAAVRAALADLSKGRRDLTDEDLMALVKPECKLEIHRRFSNGLQAYFYSIKGWLRGELVSGCTFRGSCALVMASNGLQASEFADAGLKETIDSLRTYHLSTPDPRPMAATEVVSGGRKTNPIATQFHRLDARLAEFLDKRFNRTRH